MELRKCLREGQRLSKGRTCSLFVAGIITILLFFWWKFPQFGISFCKTIFTGDMKLNQIWINLQCVELSCKRSMTLHAFRRLETTSKQNVQTKTEICQVSLCLVSDAISVTTSIFRVDMSWYYTRISHKDMKINFSIIKSWYRMRIQISRGERVDYY